MKQIAVIFDMDGVIVDNHRYHLDAWLSFFEKYAIRMSEQDYKQKINGRTMQEILPGLLEKELSPDEIHQYGEEKETLYRDLYRKHIAATPGLSSFLETLRQQQVPYAVATSAPPANVKFTLEHTGLISRFPVIVDATMVSKGKPNPEVYLTAARKLDMPSERCVVFEDAILGIQAGKNAGAKVVGVATTHTRQELEAENTDLIIDNFEGLSLHRLTSLFTL